MKLYRISIKVRPTPAHPLCWKFQFGYLLVWLLDDSYQAAGRRAAAIVELLPYERIQDTIGVVAADTLPKPPPFDAIEQVARQVGVAFYFAACPLGADEAEFEQLGMP